jgi:hypothetical protein
MASEGSDGIVFPSSTLHTNAVENGLASCCWVRPWLRRASLSSVPADYLEPFHPMHQAAVEKIVRRAEETRGENAGRAEIEAARLIR